MTSPHAMGIAQERRIAAPSVAPAVAPPEWRGIARDDVRLLVSDGAGHHHARFLDLPDFLSPGDLLVVNESATLPASLPAHGATADIDFLLNLSTRFSSRLWLAEPRWSVDRPGPMPWRPGERIHAAGIPARLMTPFRGAPRLWFVAFEGGIAEAMKRQGGPIRYGYIAPPAPPLDMYQTIFARVPGSAEMPSAARPFTPRALDRLVERGIEIARIVLHTGVSSLDANDGSTTNLAVPEPFAVPAAAAEAINRARAESRRVLAVGTTVVRALESARSEDGVRPTSGFTRRIVEPARGTVVVDGLITGLHEPGTSHRALLEAVGGAMRVRDAYQQAITGDYLWHEFGDTHLLWRR